MDTTVESNVANEAGGTTVVETEGLKTVEENTDYISLAVAKLTDELLHFKGGNMETVVHKEVAETLIKFSKQSKDFAEVVAKTPRTLSDCCAKIVSGADRNGISDIVAYRAAVQFYFPNSDVLFHMQIRHTGAGPTEEEINRPAEKPTPPQNATPRPTTVNNRKTSANAPEQNTDTNTIHLDLFED